MNSFIELQKELVQAGNDILIENIKLLLYKYDPDIFDHIDFDDDTIYHEPLLFAFFNAGSQTGTPLNNILAGYYRSRDSIHEIQVTSDSHGRIYLPGIGWLIVPRPDSRFDLSFKDEKIKLIDSSGSIPFKFEPIEFIEGTGIELLHYPLPLLQQFYYDPGHNLVSVEIEEISAKHKYNLKLAFNLIRVHAPKHFQLIIAVTKKCVIFNVDTTLRNSFATLSAQGIGFFNACQDTYNEVFFVDDIAHQTGHVIFNALIYDVPRFIKVSPTLVLETVMLSDERLEPRDVYIVFHALYTYYATFLCLDACLDGNAFMSHKKHEALGRMAFYMRKCHKDLGLIEKPIIEEHAASSLFTDAGLLLYNGIRNQFLDMVQKWGSEVKHFELNNQPYNFNYSVFLTSNPIDELY